MDLRNFLSDFFGQPEGCETETVTFVKNGITTTVTVYFNQSGYPINVYADCTNRPPEGTAERPESLDTLQARFDKALAEEDYLEAARVQREIDERNQQR